MIKLQEQRAIAGQRAKMFENNGCDPPFIGVKKSDLIRFSRYSASVHKGIGISVNMATFDNQTSPSNIKLSR